MRYAANGGSEIVGHLKYDVLIIGSGIAGLYTALNIDKKYSCCLLTKDSVETSNSWLAQGGIAAAIDADDTPDEHLIDTILAGAGHCDREAVHVLVEEGPSDIRALVGMRVPFDMSAEGDLQITREGGHRKRRIVHAGGDATGRETVKALAALVNECENVTFMGHSFFVDVLQDEDGSICGALILNDETNLYLVHCQNIVIATGGLGEVYKTSTNPSAATGDGLAAAMRAGVKLRDMEYIQFHPTGLWSEQEEGRAFLISEAVRGEGGLLKNSKGIRFMDGKHELNELAPRDIVARGIMDELRQSGEDHVFIDVTEKSKEYLSKRFPTIYNECLSRGIDISKDWIPVCPVQHYLIGGIETDLHARTIIPGLYACGEAASTGVHGANRLASNSMLECLVFGRRGAEDINKRLETLSAKKDITPDLGIIRERANTDFKAQREEMQSLMHEYGGVNRNQAGMEKALFRITEIRDELSGQFSWDKMYIENLNIATIACCILEAAIENKVSMGAHFRDDI